MGRAYLRYPVSCGAAAMSHLSTGRWDYLTAVDALLAHGDLKAVRNNNVTEGKRAWLEARDANTAKRLLPFHLRTAHQVNHWRQFCSDSGGLVLQVLGMICKLAPTKLTIDEKCRVAFLTLPWELRLLWAHSYFDRCGLPMFTSSLICIASESGI